MQKPLVSLLVLNWNGQRFLERCLTSLRGQTFRSFEIILVDNGSTDGSVEWLRSHFGDWLISQELPRLRLLELTINEGFSGGNLAGLKASDPASRYIATLNNDAWADPTWLEGLVEKLEERPAVWGAAGGPMLFASQPDKVASAGIEVRRDGLALDRAIGETLDPQEPVSEIFGPCAGAALYRREALEAVGFFEPSFFAYLEDADLAWRLRLAGWRSLYVPGAKVWHEYSGTGGHESPFKNYQLGRNRLWLIMRDWPAELLWRYGWRIAAYDLAACAYTLLKGQPYSTRGRLAALHPSHLKRLRHERRQIQSRRTASRADLESWLLSPSKPAEILQTRRLLAGTVQGR